METNLIKAEQTYMRISPRKARLVADALRKMSPMQALIDLKFLNKKSSEVFSKVIKQAVANATKDGKVTSDQLKFKSIMVDGGPIIKRFRAAARGRGVRIKKRTCNVKVILEVIKGGKVGSKS